MTTHSRETTTVPNSARLTAAIQNICRNERMAKELSQALIRFSGKNLTAGQILSAIYDSINTHIRENAKNIPFWYIKRTHLLVPQFIHVVATNKDVAFEALLIFQGTYFDD